MGFPRVNSGVGFQSPTTLALHVGDIGDAMMDRDQLKSMSTEDLWALYETLSQKIRQKIAGEKAKLEAKLRILGGASNVIKLDHVRRPYPKVLPKYQNPDSRSDTWSGRGKQPRWLTAQLRNGKKLDDFLIDRSFVRKRRRTG